MVAEQGAVVRRVLDVVVSSALLLVLAPLLLLLALLVRLGSRGPVLFAQERVGRNGVAFRLLKLRTMVADAPDRGPALTIGDDPRITRVGRVLRRWKLDELPQLLNVLRGDMSLVGPRPEVPRYVAGYTAAERRVLAVRPGITDPASLEYRDEGAALVRYADPERAYVEHILPRKLALSLAYLEQRSIGRDLGVLARTAFGVWTPAIGAGRLAVVVLALLLGGELGLRIAHRGFTASMLEPWTERRAWSAIREPGADGRLHPVPAGAAAWRLEPGAERIEYRLDADGFRIGAPAAGDAACRVLAIGDSHTFGYGVAAEDAWPPRLAAALRTTAAPATVVNAGLAGGGIADEAAWLADALPAARPTVVVITLSPWSARLDPDPPPPPCSHATRLWEHAEPRLRTIARWSALGDRLSRRTLHVLTAYTGWPPASGVAWELVPLDEPRPSFRARWDGVHTTLAAMVRRVRHAGAEAIVAFVPLDVQVDPHRNRLYRDERLPYPAYGFVDRDYSRDDRYQRALAHEARWLGVGIVDVTSALRADAGAAFLAEDYHLSPAGHRRVAAALAPAVSLACARTPPFNEPRESTRAVGPVAYRPAR